MFQQVPLCLFPLHALKQDYRIRTAQWVSVISRGIYGAYQQIQTVQNFRNH